MATLDGNIRLGRNYAELVGKFKVKLEGFCLCGGVLSADGLGQIFYSSSEGGIILALLFDTTNSVDDRAMIAIAEV